MTATHFHFDSPMSVPTVRPRRGITGEPAPARPNLQAGVVATMVRHLINGTWIVEGPQALVEEIRRLTGAVRVVLATVDETADHQAAICAVSGINNSDWSHEFEHAAAAAAKEVASEATTAPISSRPALKRFIILNHATVGYAFRLLGAERNFALLVINPDTDVPWDELIQHELTSLANILQFWAAAERGSRIPRRKSWWQRLRARVGWVTVSLALIAAAVLCIPQPYHVAADVTIEPAVRSILSAPFASKLEKTHVDPGAVVTAGQTLATLDPRDLQIELAAAETEEREVSARHQEALANRQGTSSRVAKLELEQIQFKVQTLRNRMEQLAIKSSLDGVVVRGDLRRLEGAPLTAGQTLFEVAPLDDLLAEVAIPESQIEKVREGMPVHIRLDAAPYRSWPGTIAKIHPRAELRHNDSVYIAEVKLTGDITALRPGMNGRASVTTERHPLAWNLFHRPLASFLEFAGW